jgi:hypothetical protein
VEEPKKEPLSLEELLAKKQAEEAARSKVWYQKFTFFIIIFNDSQYSLCELALEATIQSGCKDPVNVWRIAAG